MTSKLNALLQNAVTVADSSSDGYLSVEQISRMCVVAKIAGANGSNKTFLSGVLEVQTLTFPTKAGATGGDYLVISDASGGTWAAALNKAGTDPAPTGANWVAVASANKVNVDISGQTTAAQVAAAVKTALNLLSGFTAVITLDDSAANGTMTSTQIVRGPTTDPVSKKADDSGAGSATGVETTAGVATAVNPTADTVTIANHGFTRGALVTLTTSSALPTGLLTSTNYYLIVSDANTVQFASSQANAIAGTAVDITGFGTGTQTIVVTTALAGSVKLQLNIEPDGIAPNWVDVPSSSTNFSAAANLVWEYPAIDYRELKAIITVTSGTILTSVRVNGN